MRILLCTLALVVLSGVAHAGTKATTDELPAALRAMKPNTAKILTNSQAKKIRGEGDKTPRASRNPAGNFRGYKPGARPK